MYVYTKIYMHKHIDVYFRIHHYKSPPPQKKKKNWTSMFGMLGYFCWILIDQVPEKWNVLCISFSFTYFFFPLFIKCTLIFVVVTYDKNQPAKCLTLFEYPNFFYILRYINKQIMLISAFCLYNEGNASRKRREKNIFPYRMLQSVVKSFSKFSSFNNFLQIKQITHLWFLFYIFSHCIALFNY